MEVQPKEAMVVTAEGAYEEHRGRIAVRPATAQDVEPRHAGQHDIEDDDVRTTPGPFGQGGGAVRRHKGLEAGSGQIGNQDAGHGGRQPPGRQPSR